MQQESPENGVPNTANGSSISPSHSRSASDPAEPEGDSYSDPIDLIPHREHAKHSAAYRPGEYVHSKQSSGASRDSFIYSDENYSNPVDMLRAAATGGSSRSSVKSSESNTEPALPPPCRQTKTEARGAISKPPPRTPTSNGHDNIAAAIDPTYPNVGPSSASAKAVPASILPAHLDYTAGAAASPVPPYMPIQGTRRTNAVVQSDRKKRAKDKCTHQ